MTHEELVALLHDPALATSAVRLELRDGLLCHRLREAAEALRRGGPLAAALGERLARSLPGLLKGARWDPLLRGLTPGYLDADRLDQEEAEAVLLRAALLDGVRERLIYAGAAAVPASYTLIGWQDGRPVAWSRDGGHLLLAAGRLGSGKSQAATSLVEGLLRHVPGLNSELHHPTAVISFQEIADNAALPDLLFGLRPNPSDRDRQLLSEHLGLCPAPIERMRLVVPEWLLPEYADQVRPYLDLGLELVPLRLCLPQLALSGLEPFLCAGRDTSYVQFMLEEAQRLGEALTVESWHRIIAQTDELNAVQRRAAHRRLSLLERIAGVRADLWRLVQPGVLTIFCLGGRWIRHEDTLPLTVALMNALSQPSPLWGPFQRFFLLDEGNRFDRDRQMMEHLLATARQLRHRGSSLMIIGQDLSRMPDELLALASMLAVFALSSPALFDDIRGRIAGFSGWRFDQISRLLPGQAAVALVTSTDPTWGPNAKQMYFRPPLCEHGGHTRPVL